MRRGRPLACRLPRTGQPASWTPVSATRSQTHAAAGAAGSGQCGRSGRWASIDRRDAAVEEAGEQAGRPGRRADIDRRPRPRVRDLAAAVLEEAALARIGAGDLVPDGRGRLGHGDRTGADDLVRLERLVGTRKVLALGAAKADAAVALGVGAGGGGARAGIDRLVTVGSDDRLRQAERADHIAVAGTLGIDGADVLAVAIVERQADAVTFLDVACTVGEAIEDEAAGDRAQRIGLVV